MLIREVVISNFDYKTDLSEGVLSVLLRADTTTVVILDVKVKLSKIHQK